MQRVTVVELETNNWGSDDCDCFSR